MSYNPKAAMNSRRGAQNRARGEIFEQYIKTACQHYADNKTAFIEKTPEPFRITGSLGSGHFRGFFEKQAQPDFKGTLKGGRAICFDAKATETGKIPVKALTGEQVAALETHEKLGALTGVMLCFSFRTFAFIPFEHFMRAKEYFGHSYWSEEESKEYSVCFKDGYINFLENVFFRPTTRSSPSLQCYARERGIEKTEGESAETLLSEIYEKEKHNG